MQLKFKTTLNFYIFALLLAISLLSNFAKAQETDSVRIAINNILSPLNKILIPTGILAKNSYPLFDLSAYNGQLSPENTIDSAQWPKKTIITMQTACHPLPKQAPIHWAAW